MLPNRFTAKVLAMPSGCWNWNGSLSTSGYGQFSFKSKLLAAHRFSYEMLVGLIPFGLTLDHLCRNRACVNPAHLQPVTKRINTLRGEGITAQQAKQTHCKYGHEFTKENTYMYKNSRYCRECNKSRCRAYRAESPGNTTETLS